MGLKKELKNEATPGFEPGCPMLHSRAKPLCYFVFCDTIHARAVLSRCVSYTRRTLQNAPRVTYTRRILSICASPILCTSYTQRGRFSTARRHSPPTTARDAASRSSPTPPRRRRRLEELRPTPRRRRPTLPAAPPPSPTPTVPTPPAAPPPSPTPTVPTPPAAPPPTPTPPHLTAASLPDADAASLHQVPHLSPPSVLT
jgi:hypothetical protein